MLPRGERAAIPLVGRDAAGRVRLVIIPHRKDVPIGWVRQLGARSERRTECAGGEVGCPPSCPSGASPRAAVELNQIEPMDDDSEWGRKGATLSDKSAREEFGLTQDEIYAAAQAGKLQYRVGSMHGNPWLRLLRREVEALVKKKHGADYLKDRQAQTELARVNRELRRLKAEIAKLEERKAELIAAIGS